MVRARWQEGVEQPTSSGVSGACRIDGIARELRVMTRPDGAHELRTELTAFVCYDKRLRDSAQALGLPVEAPA